MNNPPSFATYLKSKGHSLKTIQSYENQLSDYQDWVKRESLEIEQVTKNELLDYIKHCKDKENAQRTIRNKLGVIHHYYQYLKAHYSEITDPTTGITIQGVRSGPLYTILEPHHLHQLYEHYPTQTTHQQRNKIIAGLLVYQGLKPEELPHLLVQDINVRSGELQIPQTRRSNGRTLKLTSPQVFDFYDYLQTVRPQLFLNPELKELLIHPDEKVAIVSRNISRQLKKLNGRVKNLKQIRASIITKWLKKYNLREVQYRAGHRYISSTEKYQQNDLESLHEEINQYHPLG